MTERMRQYGPRALRWGAYLPPMNAGATLFRTIGPDAQYLGHFFVGEPQGWLIVYQP